MEEKITNTQPREEFKCDFGQKQPNGKFRIYCKKLISQITSTEPKQGASS